MPGLKIYGTFIIFARRIETTVARAIPVCPK